MTFDAAENRTRALRRISVALCCAVMLASLAATAAWGQGSSLLDLDIGQEEELPLSPPSISGSDASAEEQPPLLEKPVIGSGGGSLDDLLPGTRGSDEEIEAEPVCDVVLAGFGAGGRNQRSQQVKLLPDYLQRPFPAARQYEFWGYSNEGKGTVKLEAFGRNISDIQYYEFRMLARAAERIGLNSEQLSAENAQLRFTGQEQFDRSAGAAALIATALTEHDSAVERKFRVGGSWAYVRQQLFQALFNVQLGQIRYLMDSNQTQMGIAACDRLKEQLPPGSPNRKYLDLLYDQVFLTPADAAIDEQNYALARDLLESYHTRYPFSQNEHMHQVQKRLTEIARQVAERAVAANDAKMLDQAAAIWPRLTGLDNMRRTMVSDYPIMHCAYNSLPSRFSPFAARTPVERHAVSLMFERLMRWRDDPRTGAHYAPELAANFPTPLARGKQFELPRCVWSDSAPEAPRYCTVDDVLWSMKLMKQVHPAGFSPAWESLVAEVDLTRVNDPFQAAIMLQRDHWQPLSLMDFPIVPKHRFPTCGEEPKEIEDFNARPVGTGPFMLAASEQASEVRMVANPSYRKPGLPHIREVVFHEMESLEARDDFLKGYIHLIHGVQPAHVVELRRQGKKVVKIPARGVYFLAPNFREPLLQNRDLRLAIAHAIDREQILDTYFRPGGASNDHAALNGPFPADSWASSPRVPQFSSTQAGAFLSGAKSAGVALRPLNLIYPDRDQGTGLACAEIQRQLAEAGIEIAIKAIDPAAFHDVVVNQHGFDLAYWRHDFEDETYWIWPLFDPNDIGPGGSNFMGHVPDQTLFELFQETMLHKQFVKIQALAHQTHEYFSREAIVIPLWQLDTYVAVSDQLTGAQFDPLYFFEDVEQWKLKPR